MIKLEQWHMHRMCAPLVGGFGPMALRAKVARIQAAPWAPWRVFLGALLLLLNCNRPVTIRTKSHLLVAARHVQAGSPRVGNNRAADRRLRFPNSRCHVLLKTQMLACQHAA